MLYDSLKNTAYCLSSKFQCWGPCYVAPAVSEEGREATPSTAERIERQSCKGVDLSGTINLAEPGASRGPTDKDSRRQSVLDSAVSRGATLSSVKPCDDGALVPERQIFALQCCAQFSCGFPTLASPDVTHAEHKGRQRQG